MSVLLNPAQATAPTTTTTPLATARQAGKDGDTTSSTMSSSTSGKGFIATILSPFKAIGSFIAMIFSKIFCCCGESEVKALKEQKAALTTFQAEVQKVMDHAEGADYAAAVAALPQDLKDAIIADLKAACAARWPDAEGKNQGYAAYMLENAFGTIVGPEDPETKVAPTLIDGPRVRAASVERQLADIEAKLTQK
jgi:hypothetical protein